MNYIILQKDSVIIPVDMVAETSGDEIRSLQEEGFAIVDDNLEASSTEQAIKKWEFKKSTVLGNKEAKNKEYKSNYGVAQVVVTMLSFIGWCIVIIGTGLILVGIASGRYGASFMQVIVSVSPGFVTAISGLFSIAAAQIVKATVDNADHSYQILKHLESK